MDNELLDAGLSLWREVEIFLRSMTSPWRIYQIGILLALLAIAHILRVFVGARMENWVRAKEGWPRWRLRVAVIVIQRLRGIFFVVLIWTTVWILREVTWPSRSYVLGIAAMIATAWIAVSFGAQLIRNKPLRRVVSWGAWIYFGLLYLGFLDGATVFLDSIAVTFDDFRISALSVLKAVVVTGLLFLSAKVALRILISRISRSVFIRRGPSFWTEDFRLNPTLCPTIDTDPKSRSYLSPIPAAAGAGRMQRRFAL